MTGFLLSLLRPRQLVECNVCRRRAPRSRMWRYGPGRYVCQDRRICYLRHCARVRGLLP